MGLREALVQHLRGVADEAEERSVYGRFVLPYYTTLMWDVASGLRPDQRALFVRGAATAAYWTTTPLLEVLFTATEWRARIAASFFTAVHQHRALTGHIEQALLADIALHDVPMHLRALAVCDRPEPLREFAIRQEGGNPNGRAAAALRAGGRRCREAAEELFGLRDPDQLETADGEHGHAQQAISLVRETRSAMLAVKRTIEVDSPRL